MTTFHNFEDMKVWQESRKILKIIRLICKRHPGSKDFNFTDQITRSTRSISANIAEGCDALTSPEFIKFLGYSKRSCGETRSHLYDALEESYISKIEFDNANNHLKKISAMLAKLIHHLQSQDRKFKRTVKSNTNNELPITNNGLY